MDSGGCVTVLCRREGVRGDGGDGQRSGVHQWTQVGVSQCYVKGGFEVMDKGQGFTSGLRWVCHNAR